MPRSARLDSPGVLHHIIIRGIERRAIFKDDYDRENFVERLSTLVPETQTICYAWVLMSNHAHFLLRSGPGGVAQLMRRLLTVFRKTPAAARRSYAKYVMASNVVVRSVFGERFTQMIETGKHRLNADEPESVGGSDRGPGPYEYLLAALGT